LRGEPTVDQITRPHTTVGGGDGALLATCTPACPPPLRADDRSQLRFRDGHADLLALGQNQLAREPGVVLAFGRRAVEHLAFVLVAERRKVAGGDEDVAGGARQRTAALADDAGDAVGDRDQAIERSVGWVSTSRRTTGSPAEEDRHRILCDSPATLFFNRP
jgi:hypothetical protein